MSILLAYGMLMMSGITYVPAGEHSLTTGYASGLVNIGHTCLAYGDPAGMNLKYRYEFSDSWGTVGSFTFAGAMSDNNALEWNSPSRIWQARSGALNGTSACTTCWG